MYKHLLDKINKCLSVLKQDNHKSKVKYLFPKVPFGFKKTKEVNIQEKEDKTLLTYFYVGEKDYIFFFLLATAEAELVSIQ